MEISNPRRILAVSRPDHGLLDLLTDLTGSKPSLSTSAIAGTTHDWPVKTPYYSTTIPIWLDEITIPSIWSTDFLAPEAREVLSALGAFIVCFRKPIDGSEFKHVKELLENVSEVVKEGCGLMWDGVCLAVAMPQPKTPYLEKSFDEWEELCQEFGFEFVDFESNGRNEYSEPTGIERLREALEANDWEAPDPLDSADLDDFDMDDESDIDGSIGFGIPRAELEEDMFGMQRAIYAGMASAADEEEEEEEEEEDGGGEGDADEEEVEKLQTLMLRMQAVRDLGADMPEAERKRFAAKAVSDIMKKL